MIVLELSVDPDDMGRIIGKEVGSPTRCERYCHQRREGWQRSTWKLSEADVSKFKKSLGAQGFFIAC